MKKQPKSFRLKRTVLYVSMSLVALWLLGDLVHSWYVGSRWQAWNAAIDRDADGVQPGCAAYTIGSGETALLLVHGINDSPCCFYKMAPAMAAKGYTCRVMRLPGFAEPLAEYASATWPQWRAALRDEASALRQQHDRVVVVAHSLGAAVSIAALLDQPKLVDGVVLLAPAIEVSDERSPILPTRVWHEFGRLVLLFTTTTYSPFPASCHDLHERDYPGRMLFTPLSIVDQTFDLIDHNRGRAAEIQTPLFMVLSQHDRVIDWRAAQQFYEGTSRDRKKLLFLDDSQHMIPVDYDWEKVCEAISEFVELRK